MQDEISAHPLAHSPLLPETVTSFSDLFKKVRNSGRSAHWGEMKCWLGKSLHKVHEYWKASRCISRKIKPAGA